MTLFRSYLAAGAAVDLCGSLHSSAAATFSSCRVRSATAATREGLRLPFDGAVQLPRT